MADIERELRKATGVKAPAADTKRQPYLRALHDAAQELDDGAWEALSDPAQEWVNAAALAVGKSKDIADFNQASSDDAAAKKPSKKPASKAKADKADKADKLAKAVKPAKPAKKKSSKNDEAMARPSGVKVRIKELIIDNPLISVDEIVNELGKAGGEVSRVTVSNIRSGFRHSLKVLAMRDKLKGVSL